jgi:hypothetical protein
MARNSVSSKFCQLEYNNLRNYFDKLGEKLNIHSLNDWYGVTSKDLLSSGGHELFKDHTLSPKNALIYVYGDTEWQPWLFDNVPRDYWQNRR